MAHSIAVDVEIEGKTYSVDLCGAVVTLSVDGVWAGNGMWDSKNSYIYGCPVPWCEETYEILDRAISQAVMTDLA